MLEQLKITTLLAVGTVLYFVGPGVPIPGCFSSLHVDLARVSSNSTTHPLGVSSSLLVKLPLTPWLFSVCLAHHRRLRSGLCFVHQAHAAECFSCIADEPSVSRLTSRDSAFPRGIAGCVASLHALLRRQFVVPVSYLSRRFLVSATSILPRSFASPRLTAIFWIVIVHVVSRSRCFVRELLVWSVPPAPSCGSLQRHGLPVVTPALLCSNLLRRSLWTCASAVVYHKNGLLTSRKLSD